MTSPLASLQRIATEMSTPRPLRLTSSSRACSPRVRCSEGRRALMGVEPAFARAVPDKVEFSPRRVQVGRALALQDVLPGSICILVGRSHASYALAKRSHASFSDFCRSGAVIITSCPLIPSSHSPPHLRLAYEDVCSLGRSANATRTVCMLCAVGWLCAAG